MASKSPLNPVSVTAVPRVLLELVDAPLLDAVELVETVDSKVNEAATPAPTPTSFSIHQGSDAPSVVAFANAVDIACVTVCG